jgi:hypothetical protein
VSKLRDSSYRSGRSHPRSAADLAWVSPCGLSPRAVVLEQIGVALALAVAINHAKSRSLRSANVSMRSAARPIVLRGARRTRPS